MCWSIDAEFGGNKNAKVGLVVGGSYAGPHGPLLPGKFNQGIVVAETRPSSQAQKVSMLSTTVTERHFADKNPELIIASIS